MGPSLMRRPPKYVHGYVDRHGRARFYFRRAGHKKVPLPGLPWSPQFMTAYEAAVSEAPRVEIGAARIKPGTVAAAVAGYFGSAGFSNHAESTRRTRRQIASVPSMATRADLALAEITSSGFLLAKPLAPH